MNSFKQWTHSLGRFYPVYAFIRDVLRSLIYYLTAVTILVAGILMIRELATFMESGTFAARVAGWTILITSLFWFCKVWLMGLTKKVSK
jgi:hypothetical protein